MVHPIRYDQIEHIKKVKVNVSYEEVEQWLVRGGLGQFACEHHKKGLEFFFSAHILGIEDEHAVLDAAGGRSYYLKAVRANTSAKRLFLTDHIYDGIKESEEGIKIVGGDISAIQLEDASIDRIACHHAFEHFQDDKDVGFIKEAHRILRKGGSLVIIPLFLVDQYVECWNVDTRKKFDENSTVVIDRTASIPGADDDGHFARLYDLANFRSRVISAAESAGFEYEIVECEVDSKSVPDMKSNFGSILNTPLRALRLVKV